MSIVINHLQSKNIVSQPSISSQIQFCAGSKSDSFEFSDMQSEKLLFPNGIANTTLSQGTYGNCQLIAVIDALIHNNSGQELIKKMVKLNSDKKNIDVYLACNDGKPITVSIEELLRDREREIRENNSVKYIFLSTIANIVTQNKDFKFDPKNHERAIWVRAVEHAYAKTLYNKYPDKFKSGNPKDVYDGDNYHCSAKIAMEDLIGVKVNHIVSSDNLDKIPNGKLKAKIPHISLTAAPDDRKNEVLNILNDFSDNKNKYLIVACTTDIADKSKYLPWHDYSIRSYDKDSGVVTFVNPWNTECEKKISLTEFLNNFESVSYTKF